MFDSASHPRTEWYDDVVVQRAVCRRVCVGAIRQWMRGIDWLLVPALLRRCALCHCSKKCYFIAHAITLFHPRWSRYHCAFLQSVLLGSVLDQSVWYDVWISLNRAICCDQDTDGSVWSTDQPAERCFNTFIDSLAFDFIELGSVECSGGGGGLLLRIFRRVSFLLTCVPVLVEASDVTSVLHFKYDLQLSLTLLDSRGSKWTCWFFSLTFPTPGVLKLGLLGRIFFTK